MGNYICNQCKKEFSRKWNILRHNKQIHQGLAIVYNKTTGLTIRDSTDSDGTPFFKSLAEDLNIGNICGKLLKPLSELESVFVDSPESERNRYLSTLIVAALDDPDPIGLIRSNLYAKRSAKGKEKIVSYLAKGMNMNNVQAEHYLKEMIKNSKIFKNYTKLDHTRL